MDSNITNRQDFTSDLLLAEPHFDEEATLLSAQPVVPLEEIQAEKRSRRRLGFGMAIISALILGALGAKLIYRGGEEQATAIVSDVARGGAASINEPAHAPSIVEGAAGATTGPLPNVPTAEAKSAPGNPVNKELIRQQAARGKSSAQARVEKEQERRFASRRLDQEPGRERRREARGHQGKSADGLSRIREIFEGPSRP
jgi:hypothetical protein